ncbi:MAG: hypothetical protein JXA66_08505 [Oligoflexia bacterium]|nr:hypothetical protein [Oligoflexia bacterium]
MTLTKPSEIRKERTAARENKTRVCPACNHLQNYTKDRCDACGLIFSKYMEYTPIKISLNRFVPVSEISDIRKTEEQLSINNNEPSKVELLLHCFHNRLLDLAAFHLRKKNDREGLAFVRNLMLSEINNRQREFTFSKFIYSVFRPGILVSLTVLLMLFILCLLLRNLVL